MTDRIDYANNAAERVKLAIKEPAQAEAAIIAQIATAEAVLALVEQQRIANLIALAHSPNDFLRDEGFDALAQSLPDAEWEGPHFGMLSEIRKGLGLS